MNKINNLLLVIKTYFFIKILILYHIKNVKNIKIIKGAEIYKNGINKQLKDLIILVKNIINKTLYNKWSKL